MLRLSDLQCKCNVNIDSYVLYMDKIKGTMDNPEWLGDFKKDDIDYLLSNGSKIWIYYDDTKEVCSMMGILVTDSILEELELNDMVSNEIVEYGPMMVSKEYRGNSLQYQMLLKEDEYFKKLGFRYALATISHSNIYSVNNLLKDDFKLVGCVKLDRGERNVYLKEL